MQLKVEDFEGGVKVTFVVVERPFVRDIVFSGNKKLDTATLTEKIDLKLGSVYNPVEVNRAAEKLKEAYEQEGYFEVVVTPETEKLPDGDVTVVFKIAEGRKITIDRVVIEGAHGVPAKEIKAVMATQERDYYVLPGTVQRQKLDEDVERIVALYNDYGYIQARVESSDVQIDRANAKAVIRIVVVEGPQFKVGGVDVTGTAVLPVEEIKRRIKLAPGDVFSRSKLRDSTKAHHRPVQRHRAGIGRRHPRDRAGQCRTARSISRSTSARARRSSSTGSISPAIPGARRRSSGGRSPWPRAISSRARSSRGRGSGW